MKVWAPKNRLKPLTARLWHHGVLATVQHEGKPELAFEAVLPDGRRVYVVATPHEIIRVRDTLDRMIAGIPFRTRLATYHLTRRGTAKQ